MCSFINYKSVINSETVKLGPMGTLFIIELHTDVRV